MRKVVTGEQVAQLYKRDPFALPMWRAPVYQTPFGIILVVKLARLLAWFVRLAFRHPAASGVLAVLALTWINTGWIGLVALVAWVLVVLATWYQGRILLPVLGKVTATRYTDRVQVRLVSGQSAADVAKRAENLAHGFGAMLAGSAPPGPAPSCWSSSAATPWPPSSPRSRSLRIRISKRSRSAAGRTGCPGSSGCTAPTSWSRAPPGPGKPRCCGD
jgi:hypothetical protein